MLASIRLSACLAAAAAVLLLCAMGPRAAAQPAGLYINAVDLDINPADMDAYMAALRENGAHARRHVSPQQRARMGIKGKRSVVILSDR